MQRIRLLRQEYGDMQKELAKHLGVGQSTLSNWERGISMPPKEILFDIADHYGVSLDYLLGYSDSRVLPISPIRLLLKEYLMERFATYSFSNEMVNAIDGVMEQLIKLVGIQSRKP